MAVSGVSNNTITNPAATDAASAQATLSGNFSTFLTLLTSQLQNQDPLSPMDSTQFTQQLVQFSQVEQQIKTNQNLEGLTAQFQAASTSAALSYLGKSAVLNSDTISSSGTGGTWGYSLPTSANAVKIEIRNAANRTVATASGDLSSGDHVFNWDGKDSNGNVMPAGNYHIVVSATDTGGASITPTLSVSAVIRGVDFTGTSPQVITDAGSIDFSKIRAVIGSS